MSRCDECSSVGPWRQFSGNFLETRPMSLLPIVLLILEYFVKQQLTAYLSENGLFSESQFAYRRQRSTEDAVVLAINRWLTAKTERKYTVVVMVDMSTAYDRVKHSRLIADLFSFHISGLALQWFCSYLSKRFQEIKIGENLSSSTACSRGVPQGSVLGPILFIIYKRSFMHSATSGKEPRVCWWHSDRYF